MYESVIKLKFAAAEGNMRNLRWLWVKSGSAEVRDAGLTTGKKREIKPEVSRFLAGYDVMHWV